MKKLLLFFSIICIKQINAQTWVTIPDANFVTYLQSTVPVAMHGDSLDISSALVTTSTYSINVQNKNIADLNGVQYFSSLTYLNCSLNQLSTLPTLPSSITYLACSSNQLINLPPLPHSLTDLYCNDNSLTALPALNNGLVNLDCGYNSSLTTLPALPSSLKGLACFYNALTTLPTLPDSLVDLQCNNNSLTSLPNLPSTLIELDCGPNNLTSLPSPLPPSLQYLYCQYNNLTSLPVLPNSLQYLTINNNNITCLPYMPGSIGYLHMFNNPFTCLPNYIAVMGSDTLTYPICTAGNANGCAFTTNIEQTTSKNKISIYPNPNTGSFSIETGSTEKQNLRISDVGGKCVLSQIISGKTLIDANSLNSGVYNITLIGIEKVLNEKLVIAR